MSDYYILRGREIVPVADVLTWGRFFDNKEGRTVGRTEIGDVTVSTVFLGIDHGFGAGGPPLLFETMIFGGKHNEYQERCATYSEAEAMHARAVSLVRETA